MVHQERSSWSSLIATAVALICYVATLAPQVSSRPVTEVDWVPTMLWAIGGAVVGAIVLRTVWGVVAGMRDRDDASGADERDRDIARLGDRVGQAFLVLAGLAAIALCALEVDGFWIAQTLFAGFAVSALVGGAARVVAYRRGLV